MKMKQVRISCRDSGASALGRWWTSLAKSKSNPGCGEPRRYAGSACHLLHNVRQAAADPDSLWFLHRDCVARDEEAEWDQMLLQPTSCSSLGSSMGTPEWGYWSSGYRMAQASVRVCVWSAVHRTHPSTTLSSFTCTRVCPRRYSESILLLRYISCSLSSRCMTHCNQ